MRFPIKKEVQAFSPYIAGLSIDEIKEKYGLEDVIKLASNENSLGMSPKVVKAMQDKAESAFRYPQMKNPQLTQALAKYHNIDANRIVVGNGSDEMIDLLIRVMATPGEHNIVASDPCFIIYCTQVAFCNVEFRQIPLKEDLTFDLDGLLNAVDDKTAIVFLTNPDNPTGLATPADTISAFAEKLPSSCLLALDEAYIDFADEQYQSRELLDKHSNIAVLRTFSKCYGLAGLRIGYGIFPEEIADYIRRVRLPFSLNVLAEEAAITALADEEFYAKSIAAARTERVFLTEELSKLGFTVYPSQSSFVFMSVPENVKAHDLFIYLLEHGVIVRTLEPYNFLDHIRISTGLPEENAYLIKCIKDFLA